MKRVPSTMTMILVLVATVVGAGERTHQIEAEDYFSIAGITGIALSPDGSTAAWCESRWDVEADGRTAALVTAPDNEVVHHEGWSRVEVLDIATGELTEVTKEGWRNAHDSPFGWIDDVQMAGDGRALGFTISFDGYPTRAYTASAEADGWTLTELDRPDGVSVNGGSLRWQPDSTTLYYTGESRARVHLYRQKPGNSAAVMTPGDVTIGSFAFDARVPPAHSRGLYRALRIYLGVPTELIVYPGAHHGLTTYTHREAKMAWDLAWFEKYLGAGWSGEAKE